MALPHIKCACLLEMEEVKREKTQTLARKSSECLSWDVLPFQMVYQSFDHVLLWSFGYFRSPQVQPKGNDPSENT